MTPAKKKLLSLHLLLRDVGVTAAYSIPSSIKELLALTDAGKFMLEELKKRTDETDENALYFALLLDLYHKEFWIDAEKSDMDGLIGLFDQMFYSAQLQIPWMFGRDLYDNYSRLFVEEKKELNENETYDLLENSPVGVAQVGNLLVGPFGLIDSNEARPILPTNTMPLWHCSDLGCEHLHSVELTLLPIPERILADVVNDIAVELLGDGENWRFRLFETFPYQADYYNDKSVNDIAATLISCLSMIELRRLTAQLLRDNSQLIRDTVKMRGQAKTLFKNSADLIASKLKKDECLQIALIVDDASIICALEKLIHNREISVPAEEVRSPQLGGRGPSGWLGMYSQISKFGFRRLSRRFADTTMAISRLRKLVLDFYDSRGFPNHTLEHLLRYQKGATILQKLDNYLSACDPREVLHDLISIHPGGLEQSIDFLKYGYSPPLTKAADEAELINKILWKLGFSVPAYSSALRVFDDRLDLLLKSSRGITNSSEADRDRARSAAVNLFVSLEEILDSALAYSTWLFLSDHYAGSRFMFRVSDGRLLAKAHLHGRKIGKEKLMLKSDGKNTLFPLIESLGELSKYVGGLRSKSGKKYLRDAGDTPGYAESTQLEDFPFRHTLFLFDISENDLTICRSVLSECAATFKKGDVCDVRNRLEHKREDFPSRVEIETCCDAISNAVKMLVDTGLYPLDHYRSATTVDSFGREFNVYENYLGSHTTLKAAPSHLLSYHWPENGPITVTEKIHIGDSSDVFYAHIVSVSEYSIMWEDYPRHRKLEELAKSDPVPLPASQSSVGS